MPTAKAKTRKSSGTATSKSSVSTAKAKPRPTKAPATILGDAPGTLTAIQRAMESGARKAVAENDRYGISTPGAKDGKVIYRTPTRTRSK